MDLSLLRMRWQKLPNRSRRENFWHSEVVPDFFHMCQEAETAETERWLSASAHSVEEGGIV